MRLKRFAQSQQFNDDLTAVLKPWSDARRSGDNPSWYGRTGEEWVEDARSWEQMIRHRLRADGNTSRTRNLLADQLYNERGYSDGEARQTVSDIVQGKPFRQLNLGIASANADEELSKFLLQQAGGTEVRLINGDPVYGTDIEAKLKDRLYKIDAQTRVGRQAPLNIGVLSKVPQSGSAVRSARSRDITLRDLISEVREANQGSSYMAREDKLLHTPNVDIRPSAWLENNVSDMEKNGIITSDRAGYRQTLNGLTDNHGPYDPTLPQGWGLINLDTLRSEVLDKKLSEIQNMGMLVQGQLNDNKPGKINLTLKKETVDKLTKEGNLLDPKLIEALSQVGRLR